jgi:hypothetical protein
MERFAIAEWFESNLKLAEPIVETVERSEFRRDFGKSNLIDCQLMIRRKNGKLIYRPGSPDLLVTQYVDQYI